MHSVSKDKNFSMTWWHLVKEIREIEELIADAREPEDVHSVWALHLLHSSLKAKRQKLQEHMSDR
jgi:predicted RNase H-like nuclease